MCFIEDSNDVSMSAIEEEKQELMELLLGKGP
jgi:hypothetical protein